MASSAAQRKSLLQSTPSPPAEVKIPLEDGRTKRIITQDQAPTTDSSKSGVLQPRGYKCHNNTDKALTELLGKVVCRRNVYMPRFFQGESFLFLFIFLTLSFFLLTIVFRINYFLHRENFITDTDFEKKYGTPRSTFMACSSMLSIIVYILFLIIVLYFFEFCRNRYIHYKLSLSTYNDGHSMRFFIMLLCIISLIFILGLLITFWQKQEIDSNYKVSFIIFSLIATTFVFFFTSHTIYTTCFGYKNETDNQTVGDQLCKQPDAIKLDFDLV
jgi:hypothetical protein